MTNAAIKNIVTDTITAALAHCFPEGATVEQVLPQVLALRPSTPLAVANAAARIHSGGKVVDMSGVYAAR